TRPATSSRRSKKRARRSRRASAHETGAALPRRFHLEMIFSLDLLTEALIFGVLLGCFYAAVSIGLSVSFGLLDVPNVAHPAVMVFGSYLTFVLTGYGLDPIVAGVLLMPAFSRRSETSTTMTCLWTSTCVAARPMPGAAYMVSVMSATSFFRPASNTVTGAASLCSRTSG